MEKLRTLMDALRGPGREDRIAAARALATRGARRFPHLTMGQAALVPGGWQDLAGNPAPPPDGPVLAVAAVARPEAFEVHVESETGQKAELMAFPDHHDFRLEDVRAMRARAGERTVVVTEKDAVKLQLLKTTLGPVRVLVQTLRWEAGEEAVTQLVTAVAQRASCWSVPPMSWSAGASRTRW